MQRYYRHVGVVCWIPEGVLVPQAGALAEACKSYAAEARRLAATTEAEEVASQFAELQQTLEAL